MAKTHVVQLYIHERYKPDTMLLSSVAAQLPNCLPVDPHKMAISHHLFLKNIKYCNIKYINNTRNNIINK